MKECIIELGIPNFNLHTIAKSGQCFRLNKVSSSMYRVVAYGKLLDIEVLGDCRYRFHCSPLDYIQVWSPYFDIDTDYCHYCICVNEDDVYLQSAITYGSGMRILRQEPWEMLITFILSQQKTIPSIKQAVEMLCQKYGTPMDHEGVVYYAFPTPDSLAILCEQDLLACSLGYRAKYVLDASRQVASGQLDLSALASVDNETLMSALMQVYGVGAKVANCVMLYGYHRLNVLPVDTWIKRIIEREYNGTFPLSRYGQHAGVLQQYVFLYERHMAGKI